MEPTVTTSYGEVAGNRLDDTYRYLGIPYAAAPVGPRRMRPPEPPPAWTGTRDATRYGPTVPKSPYPWPHSELLDEPEIPGTDCLNLNVWAPGGPGPHPVFVWLHGGAFVNGSGAVPQYDGTAFARDGVVCVTINYRLGADGFLDTGDDHTNIGLLDQIAALRWIEDNIAAFGGDPGRVTIGGESAGAMSVATLLAGPEAAGLFQGAILQSGAGHHALTRPTAQKIADGLAARLGVPATREAIAAAPPPDVLAAQGALAADIRTGPDPAHWGEAAANTMPFEPVIDGQVVPALPIEAIRSGAGADVPVLIGTNHDENLLFMAPSGALSQVTDHVLRAAVTGYGFTDADTVIKRYAEPDGRSPGHTLAAIATDWMFRIPAIRLLEARAHAPANSYMYEFRWESTAAGGELGACHYLEIPFVFDTLATPGARRITGPGAPQELAAEMHQAWVRFIRDGDPGWTPYTPPIRTVRVFGGDTRTEDDPARDRRELWAGLR